MAEVNRYTQIQGPRYNPRTLQELMVAPMYKRQQHDELLNNSSLMDSALVNVDPLDIHADVATKEQQRLQEQMKQQVDLLNSEGFTPSSKSKFMDLNKQYQQSIAPTGVLGRIGAAKQALAEARKAHFDAAKEAKQSSADAMRNWQMHEQAYKDEFAKTGKITPIGQLGAPTKVDYIAQGMDIFKSAGFTEKDIARGLSNFVTQDPVNGSYIINEETRKGGKYNTKALQAGLDLFNMQLSDPNSEIRQSLAYQGKDPNNVLKELELLAQSRVIDSTTDHYSKTFSNWTPVTEDDKKNGIPEFTRHIIQGVPLAQMDPTSVVLKMDKIKNPVFNEDGKIVKTSGAPLEIPKAPGTLASGLIGYSIVASQLKDDVKNTSEYFDKLRKDIPVLSKLTDKELYTKLDTYRRSIASNYMETIDLVGANYELVNNKYFGNLTGKGERTAGTLGLEGVTINGTFYQSGADIAEQLGYSSEAEMQEKSKMAITDAVPVMGSWKASAFNKDGQSVNLYIPDEEIGGRTVISQVLGKAAMEGKSFANLGPDPSDPAKHLYFVNDFVNPVIVSYPIKDAQERDIPKHFVDKYGVDAREIYASEKVNLLKSPIFNSLSNVVEQK